MNYTKVEDSQIAEVGFGEGYYGPETLGIRFQPSKKQAAAGNTGSEYHYGNDRAPHSPSQTHARLIAAPDTGKWFGENIKKRPDLYPYVKIEDGKTYDIPLFESTPGAIAPAQEEPAPTTALAVIDTMADDLLFTPNAVTDAQLAAGREWYLTEAKKYDISTEKNRAELKRFARPLQKLRTGIEARAKELTGATKRKIAAIDAEKRRLVLLVGGIEDEVLRPLTEWEQEEEARKVRLAGIQNELAAKGQRVYMDMAEIEKAIAELEAFDVSTMQEYKVGAEIAIAASLRVLKPELERRREADTNARELADLRRKQAERDEADRVAEEKRQEQARIDAAVQAKLDAALEAAKEATRQEVIAELAPLPVSTATAPAKGFGSPAAVQAAQEYASAEHRHSFVAAYQAVTILKLGELWAIPIMLRLALIESCH